MNLEEQLDNEARKELVEVIRPHYTQKELAKMRKDGKPKPDGVTWSEWMAPFSLKPAHEKILYMAAMGHNAARISDETGITLVTVSRVIQSDRGRFRIAELQHHLFGKSIKKRFQALASRAVDTVEQIMDDPSVKANTRLSAANIVFDRAFGKPKQTIDQTVTNASSIFDKIDEIIEKTGKVIETTYVKNENVEEAEIVEKQIVIEKKIDDVDKWCKENLK